MVAVKRNYIVRNDRVPLNELLQQTGDKIDSCLIILLFIAAVDVCDGDIILLEALVEVVYNN
jgi:hypothetical protein